jgi:hypothetical protein
MISASFAFTRPVISRLSPVLGMVKRVCLISGVDYGQFCTLRFPVMGALAAASAWSPSAQARSLARP